MDKKEEISRETLIKNVTLIEDLISKNQNFLFYFSPDPDAVGVSVAFALYLRTHNKECSIYLPEGFDQNLDFLFDMAVYNKIVINKDINVVQELILNFNPVIVSCDTPTHFLLPEFERVETMRSGFENRSSIEIDHHFGGDSEQIFEESIPVFLNANSCCEIMGEILEIIDEKNNKNNSNKIFSRNVVLSLLVGLCFDTQFGKFVVNKDSYDKWFNFLSDRLKLLTWNNSKNINSAQIIFDTINRMSRNKEKVMKQIVGRSEIKNGVGLLIIPPIGKYDSLSETNDSTCILSKLILDMSNMIPEYSGAIGILAFFDSVYKIYFIKIRRSLSFKEYDLRTLENLLEEIFGVYFLGGGGHPGATSFRIAAIERDVFMEKIKIFYAKLSVIVEDLTKNISPNNDIVLYQEEGNS